MPSVSELEKMEDTLRGVEGIRQNWNLPLRDLLWRLLGVPAESRLLRAPAESRLLGAPADSRQLGAPADSRLGECPDSNSVSAENSLLRLRGMMMKTNPA